MYVNDNPDEKEDNADEDADSEEEEGGDISYATRLSGQCLGPSPFFGRHQFIKLDHMLYHFGPHPTNISPLPLCALILKPKTSAADYKEHKIEDFI